MPLFRQQNKQAIPAILLLIALVALAGFSAGCKRQEPGETSDPQLKPIQEMLEQNLPIGTSDATVQTFLASRGYTIETPDKPGTMVATMRHIDTQTVQPVTARVTFYFDANGKLNTYEIRRIFNQRVP
jgi:hypothetical protein